MTKIIFEFWLCTVVFLVKFTVLLRNLLPKKVYLSTSFLNENEKLLLPILFL